MDRRDSYQKLYKSFVQAYPNNTKQKNQADCNHFWNSIKEKNYWITAYKAKMAELQQIIRSRKSILDFFSKPSTSTAPISSSASTSSAPSTSDAPTTSVASSTSSAPSTSSTAGTFSAQSTSAPKQQQLQKELNALNAEIVALGLREVAHLLSDNEVVSISKKRKRAKELELNIVKLQQSQQRMKKLRLDKKEGHQLVMILDF